MYKYEDEIDRMQDATSKDDFGGGGAGPAGPAPVRRFRVPYAYIHNIRRILFLFFMYLLNARSSVLLKNRNRRQRVNYS